MRQPSLFRQVVKDESGQALSEYTLLIALIAVALIVTVVAFREQIKTKLTALTTTISTSN